jgi:hypothetical protein
MQKKPPFQVVFVVCGGENTCTLRDFLIPPSGLLPLTLRVLRGLGIMSVYPKFVKKPPEKVIFCSGRVINAPKDNRVKRLSSLFQISQLLETIFQFWIQPTIDRIRLLIAFYLRGIRLGSASDLDTSPAGRDYIFPCSCTDSCQ